jgi:hypothetical protein
MKRWLSVMFIVLTLILMAACAAPVTPPLIQASDSPSPIPAGNARFTTTPTLGLAGQSVSVQYTALALQQTQAELQVRAVEATAQVQQTLNAQYFQTTRQANTQAARANEFYFQSTVGAATQSARETQVAFSVTTDALTRAAISSGTAQAFAATATAQAVEQRRAQDTLLSGIGLAFVVALCVAVIASLLKIGKSIAKRLDPNNNPQNVRVLRLPNGTLVIKPLLEGGFEHLLLAAPVVEQAGLRVNDAVFETDEETTPGVDDVPIYERGKWVGTYNRAETEKQLLEDAAHREFMLRFLRKCMKAAGQQGAVIPPHDKLGISTETWSKATQLMPDLIEKKRGRHGGTRLVGKYRTLYEVWLAVGEKRYIPRLKDEKVIEGNYSPALPTEAVELT